MSIREEYNGVVSELAERARLIMDEGTEKSDAVRQAISDGFFYAEDEAVVIAHAFENGFFKWGEGINWIEIEENLFKDIYNEVENGVEK